MAGHDDLRRCVLSPGWQAQLRLQRNKGGISVFKTFGVDCGWTRSEALSISRCAARYRKWLTAQGVLVLQSTEQRIEQGRGEWLFSLVQPYVGLDCDARLTVSSTNETGNRQLVRALMTAALRVAFPTKPPLFRTEIKPRDFCATPRGTIVLVDTFPPVIARHGRKLVVGSRRDTESCLARREREEVLAVTGSALGILRNLCEHLMSISPSSRKDVVGRLVSLTGRICSKTSNELVSYLKTDRSARKVSMLVGRRNQRGVR